jgi:hypothetical protein
VGEWSVTMKTDADTFVANQSKIIKMIAQEASSAYGYTLCSGCQQPVVEEVGQITGGRCIDCLRSLSERAMREIEVMVEGAIARVRPEQPKRRYGSRGSKTTRRAVEHAKRRALRRLRYLHPDEYLALFAQERERAGLAPSPLSAMIGTVVESRAYDHDRVLEDGDQTGRTPAPKRR